MKRWLIPALVVILMAPIVALATGTLTIPVNFGALTSPANTAQLDTAFNAVRDYINTREITQDVAANRPAAGVKGRYYFATDTPALYNDTGSAWTQIASAAVYTNQLTGLTLSNPPAAPGTTLGVAAGAAASNDATITSRVLMTLSSAVTKTITTWAVGTGNGCLDTGTVAINTWYHIYVIQRTDTGVVDILCSTSATAPTMPTNYTKRRRIGADLTDGNGALNFFTQFTNEFIWATPSALNVNEANNHGTVAFTASATTPNGVVTKALMHVVVRPFSGAGVDLCAYFSALASSDTAPVSTATPLCTQLHLVSGNTGQGGGQSAVWTDTAQSYRVRLSTSAAGDVVRAATLGWYDPLQP